LFGSSPSLLFPFLTAAAVNAGALPRRGRRDEEIGRVTHERIERVLVVEVIIGIIGGGARLAGLWAGWVVRGHDS
jgi:hypothetical protein